MDIYPAIDLLDGHAVRLYQGDFDRRTAKVDDPVGLAASYRDAGAQWLHVVDLDGARRGRFTSLGTVASIAHETGMAVQAGGGVRTGDDLRRLFDAGVSRAVIGSVAVREPETATDWLAEHGSERICLALDVKFDREGTPRLTVSGWTDTDTLSLWEGLERYGGSGLCHVLCTDVGRDGTLQGPSVELYRRASERFPALEFQASGGVRGVEDLRALRETGAAAAIVGRALIDGELTLAEALAS